MIDIFGQGPHLIKMSELLFGCMKELGVFYLHFFFYLAIILILKRLTTGRTAKIIALLLPILQIVYVWTVSIKSEFLFSFFLAFLITAQVGMFKLLPLQALDYAFLFSSLLFPVRLFNNTSTLIGNLWIFWILFCALYTTAKLGIHKLKGHHFNCYFLFVFLLLSMYSYTLAGLFLYPAFTEQIGSSALGIVCAISFIIILLLSITIFIKIKFCTKLLKLNQFGGKYRSIERYFFGFSILILMVFTLIYLPFTISGMQNMLVALLIPCLCLTLLWIQIPFIFLLFRVAFYKDNATFHEWEKGEIASYYKELSGSLATMQGIRHDIKNIFFTMGNFVNRSNDIEMKDFFWEKIYPYSIETIRQSEFLSKLYQIPIESLRAFLNLKSSQALSQKVAFYLDVNIIPENFHVGIDIIDLTRILGILIDNAIEETVQIPGGMIEIKIIGNDADCSYIIKNSITEQTQKQGIHAGRTNKGSGHGKGLQIVQQLLEQYHNTTLNSSMQRHIYVQSLNININLCGGE